MRNFSSFYSLFPLFASVPVLLQNSLLSAGVSGPSRAIYCVWQPHYFKSADWAKLEWAIPPVPAGRPVWLELLGWEESWRGGWVDGAGGRVGGCKKAATCIKALVSHEFCPAGSPCEERSWLWAVLDFCFFLSWCRCISSFLYPPRF